MLVVTKTCCTRSSVGTVVDANFQRRVGCAGRADADSAVDIYRTYHVQSDCRRCRADADIAIPEDRHAAGLVRIKRERVLLQVPMVN